MAVLDVQRLKKLREETGISFSLCKKALEESHNDIEKAKKLLALWGVEKAKDKEQRETSQGALFAYVHYNKKIASLVELSCETDFVSGNSEFQKLGQELAMQVASIDAKNADELLKQEYIRDPSKKIEGLIKKAILKFGENIKIKRILKWELGL